MWRGLSETAGGWSWETAFIVTLPTTPTRLSGPQAPQLFKRIVILPLVVKNALASKAFCALSPPMPRCNLYHIP